MEDESETGSAGTSSAETVFYPSLPSTRSEPELVSALCRHATRLLFWLKRVMQAVVNTPEAEEHFRAGIVAAQQAHILFDQCIASIPENDPVHARIDSKADAWPRWQTYHQRLEQTYANGEVRHAPWLLGDRKNAFRHHVGSLIGDLRLLGLVRVDLPSLRDGMVYRAPAATTSTAGAGSPYGDIELPSWGAYNKMPFHIDMNDICDALCTRCHRPFYDRLGARMPSEWLHEPSSDAASMTDPTSSGTCWCDAILDGTAGHQIPPHWVHRQYLLSQGVPVQHITGYFGP